jgi:hypothetical protein
MQKAIAAYFVVGLLGAFGSSCATSASVQASRSTGNALLDYYPLLPGWGWAYDVENGGGKVLALYSVAERRGDIAVVKNGESRIEYAILPDGIARMEGSVAADFLLKLPIRKGASWGVTDGQATIVEAGAQVALPSGTYRDCVVVEEVRGQPSRVTRTTYCQGEGPVAIEMRVYSPIKKEFETMVHASLLSVTRPEEAGKSD